MAESQDNATVEQQVPVEPKTYETQEAIHEAMKTGEINPRDYAGPEDMVNKLLKQPQEPSEAKQSQETPEVKQPQDVSRETPQPEAPKQEQPKPETPLFKSFGEMLKFARDELGEEYENAHDFIQKVKNKKEHLTRNQTALNRWREDATKNKQIADNLQSQLKQLQDELKKRSEPPQPQQPAPVEQPKQEDNIEPEIPMPDELADAKEWVEYARKTNERNQRIFKKEMESRLSEMEKRSDESEKKWQQRLEEEKERVRKENDERIAREAAQRQFEATIASADKFISKRKEFDFGVPTKEMNDKYGQFASQVEYIKQQNPAYAHRDLVSEYFNGVPDAVQMLQKYAVEPPKGTKQFAILMELEKISRDHHLYTNEYRDSKGNLIGGDPDFDAAYAIKKARDGADIDELNQSYARGADQTLNAVQERQRQQPEIGAREAAASEENQKVTQEQIMQRMQQLQSQMSTMTPEQRQKARVELAGMANQIGLVEQQA